jgi:magnesium chelatase family protein
MNPCPCGAYGDPERECTCPQARVTAYRARVSGPLLDRFDMQVAVGRLTRRDLLGAPDGESSEAVRSRVERARALQARRYSSAAVTNASASKAELEKSVHLSARSLSVLGSAIDCLAVSGRGVDRVLRLARTVADLDGAEEVGDGHLAEALALRADDRSDEAVA